MSQDIWDQGRVVGYSSYEIYLKKHFEKYPDIDPPSEEQWLASSLAMGQSMIVSVPNTSDTPTSYWEIIKTDGDYKVMDLYFSEKFKMVAANNIIGSFFSGVVQLYDGSKFASWVVSYGSLVGNENTTYPTGTKGEKDTVDPRDSVATSDTMKGMLTDYMKILDAVIIQPGTWKSTGLSRPRTELKPDYTEKPRLRLLIKGEITTSPKILLTGFSYASQVAGVSKDNGAVNTSNRVNGDFLGPEVFPWCSKVTLTIPTLYTEIANSQPGPTPEEYHPPGYTRKLPSEASSFDEVPCEAFNDFVEYDSLKSYMNTYQSNHQAIADPAYVSPVVDMTVGSSFTSHDNYQLSGLTIYSKDSQFPPVLYAHKVSSAGGTELNPIDSPAIGSVKIFTKDMVDDPTDRISAAKTYFRTYPGVVVYFVDDHGNLFQIVRNYKGTSDTPLTAGGTEHPGKRNGPFITYVDELHGGDVYTYVHTESGTEVREEFIWNYNCQWKRTSASDNNVYIPVASAAYTVTTDSETHQTIITKQVDIMSIDWDGEKPDTKKTSRVHLSKYYPGSSLSSDYYKKLHKLQVFNKVRIGDSGPVTLPAFQVVDYNGDKISGYPNNHIVVSTLPEFSVYNRDIDERVISIDAIPDVHQNLTWGMLLTALANDVSMDILGDALKRAKTNLIGEGDGGYPYLEFGPYFKDTYPRIPGGNVLGGQNGITTRAVTDGGHEWPEVDGRLYSTSELKLNDYVSYNNKWYVWSTATGPWKLDSDVTVVQTQVINENRAPARLYVCMSQPYPSSGHTIPENSIWIGQYISRYTGGQWVRMSTS